MEQKVDEAMVAVGDETGLKKLIGGDLSDTDSSDEEDDSMQFFYFLKNCYLKSVFLYSVFLLDNFLPYLN